MSRMAHRSLGLLTASLLAAAPMAAEPVVPPIDAGSYSLAGAPLKGQVKLGTVEQRAVALANAWKGRLDYPVPAADGSVQFLYGATLPTVVCSPLYVCDLRLQAGERVTQLDAGDAVRWRLSPALSGQGENATAHVMMKPVAAGLVSNLVIHTDRRTYHIKLVSHPSEWMPMVSFDYPETWQDAWIGAGPAATRPQPPEPAPVATPEYRISGDHPPWRPTRVYSNGQQTIIQFPKTFQHHHAPILVARTAAGGPQLVNYRLVDQAYHVDSVLDQAALISGVGRHQVQVTIRRVGGPAS